MPVDVDVLETRLDLVGLGTFTSGFGSAASAVGLLDGKLTDLQRKNITLGVTGLAASAGVLATLAEWTHEAAGEQTAYNTAARNFKGSFPVDELEEWANGLSRLTGIDDDRLASIAGILGTFALKGSEAKQLVEPILNAEVALKALGVTAEQMSNATGKALQTGDASGLRRTGVIIDTVAFKSANLEQRIRMVADALNQQGGSNAAQEFAKTYEGQLQALNTELGNFRSNVGAVLTGPGTAILGTINSALQSVNDMGEGKFSALGIGAATAAGAVALLSARLIWSTLQAKALEGENAQLLNKQLKAAQGADTLGDEEAETTRQMDGAASAAGTLAGKLGPLATAHDRAAAAANRQADAEARLGRAGAGGPTASQVGGSGGSKSTPGGGTAAAGAAAAGAAGTAGTATVSKLGAKTSGAAAELGEFALPGGSAVPKPTGAMGKLKGGFEALKGKAGKAGDLLNWLFLLQELGNAGGALSDPKSTPLQKIDAAAGAGTSAAAFIPGPVGAAAKGIQWAQFGIDSAANLIPEGKGRDAAHEFSRALVRPWWANVGQAFGMFGDGKPKQAGAAAPAQGEMGQAVDLLKQAVEKLTAIEASVGRDAYKDIPRPDVVDAMMGRHMRRAM